MNKEEQLLAKILNIFSDRFNQHAVLRGGMVLRLLGSSRLTNDLDYVFTPFKSKKEIVDDVLDTLNQLEGVELQHSLNSKCLRVIISNSQTTVQIEAKVAEEVATDVSSTKELADIYSLPPRLIPVMDYSVALAHKMAAWNERRLVRDIYDIWFYIQMGIRPDEKTLIQRLKKPLYSKKVKPEHYFDGEGAESFYNFLRDQLSSLTEEELNQEMRAYLPPAELPGLLMKFRAALVKL